MLPHRYYIKRSNFKSLNHDSKIIQKLLKCIFILLKKYHSALIVFHWVLSHSLYENLKVVIYFGEK